MGKRFYILKETGVKEIKYEDFLKSNDDLTSLYLVEIKTAHRETVSEFLSTDLKIHPEICKNIISPGQNIRFEYYDDFVYGEIATFSSITRRSNYSGVISHKNVIIGIHHGADSVLHNVDHYLQNFTNAAGYKIRTESFLFSMVHEILSEYGKMILNYREGIEEFAVHLHEQTKSLSPKKLLIAKSQLSDFSRVLERLFYTLSFPPTIGLLDEKSSYRESFDYLLKITTLLTSSIQQTEDRLESLNDHYQLLLQNKANKRLNLLTIVQAIFVPLTLLVGVYGMNFSYMPELSYHYGYFFSVGGMVLFVLVSLYFFYRNGWFKD